MFEADDFPENVTFVSCDGPDWGKWPRMVVVGEKVTQDQAKEIILRTEFLPIGTNDKSFCRSANMILGLKKEDNFLPVKEVADTFKSLCWDLYYMHNSRVASFWAGGPHGWCHWDGTIGCCNYNIGKWPSIYDVAKDWSLIAKTFPYLDLKCYILSENDEIFTPSGCFEIKEGKVTIRSFDEEEINSLKLSDFKEEFASNERTEIGCTLEFLQESLDFVKRKVSSSNYS